MCLSSVIRRQVSAMPKKLLVDHRESGQIISLFTLIHLLQILTISRFSSFSQDLKDFMREAGEVVFSDVSRDGNGVVEFAREQDMLW